MIITDTLSNLFSIIKNGYLSKKSQIITQKSKQSINILNILVREGFIKSFKISSNKIEIFLKYKNNKAIITEISRLSKPSRRQYIKNKDLYIKKKGFYILSTSNGILTEFDAKKLNLGGELICKIF